jgi:hypothetical protein
MFGFKRNLLNQGRKCAGTNYRRVKCVGPKAPRIIGRLPGGGTYIYNEIEGPGEVSEMEGPEKCPVIVTTTDVDRAQTSPIADRES